MVNPALGTNIIVINYLLHLVMLMSLLYADLVAVVAADVAFLL
jgi:hypothetical protein